MTTMSQKTAFIKANKKLVSSTKLTNQIIAGLTEDQADALVAEIQAHPEYTVEETVVPTATTAPLEIDGVEQSEEFGSLLHLPYVGRSKNGFKFQFGESFAFCNDGSLFILDDKGKLEIGQVFAFKADTLKAIKDSKFFSIRLNYSADATIANVNEKIDAFQGAIETKIKIRAKKYGIDYLTAKAEIHALMQKEEDAEFVANMPKLEI